MTRKCAFLLYIFVEISSVRHAEALECELTRLGGAVWSGTPVGREDCNKTITVQVSGTNESGKPFTLHSGTNCTDTATPSECPEIASGTLEISNQKLVEIDIEDILESYEIDCDQEISQTVSIRLFQEENLTDLNLLTDSSGSNVYKLCGSFEVSTESPSSPTDVTAAPGENEITVSWDYDGTNVENYYVYYSKVDDCSNMDGLIDAEVTVQEEDDAGMDDQEEDSGLSIQTLDEIKKKDRVKSTSKTKTFDPKAEVGQEIAIWVTAVTEAGNESDPSVRVCTKIVKTKGFCELHGNCETGCSVNVQNNGRTDQGFPVLWAAVLSLIWAFSRRKL